MRKKNKPLHISDAWQRIAKGRKRVNRQRRMVERIRQEGRDATRAERLLSQFIGAQTRREKRLQAALGTLTTRHPRSPSSKLAKSAQWNARVLAFLDRQYPNAPNYKASLVALWDKYQALGLPNAHFVSEFTSGKKSVVFQRAWEMMLARHLDAQGHHLTTAAEGPDFRFEHNGLVVWVEAVSPEPMGVPDHWLEHPKPGEFKVGDVPHNEVLLRWTTAIEAKWKKLKTYRDKKIVGKRRLCDRYQRLPTWRVCLASWRVALSVRGGGRLCFGSRRNPHQRGYGEVRAALRYGPPRDSKRARSHPTASTSPYADFVRRLLGS